ncbi:hypothetical protein [Anoxybacteroides tepidamans]|uniref:hypothetical protein n=1 Tax=Anoxybacteroides tepidamans TaxID=265948 RepID=UPI0004894730|nr:hypothetical protein [Anoxybacillus tepidamans]
MFRGANIRLSFVKVNAMDRSSSISTAQAMQVGRRVATKRNQGFGEQNADGVSMLSEGLYVSDDDGLDASAKKDGNIIQW